MFRVGLHSALLIVCATLIIQVGSYADLISDLMQKDISVLSSGHDGYLDSSRACKSFDLFLYYPAMIQIKHDPTDNLRFTFKPAAITFPKTAMDVSTIMKIA